MSLLTYVKENPIETAVNVATLIPAVGGVIKGGSLLYKAGKTLNKVYNRELKLKQKHAFSVYKKNLQHAKKVADNKTERVDLKLMSRDFYKTIKSKNFYMEPKPQFLKQTLLNTTKAQQGSGLIVGGIGATAHLKGLQK